MYKLCDDGETNEFDFTASPMDPFIHASHRPKPILVPLHPRVSRIIT